MTKAYLIRSGQGSEWQINQFVVLRKDYADQIVDEFAHRQYESDRHYQQMELDRVAEELAFYDAMDMDNVPASIRRSFEYDKRSLEAKQSTFDERYASFEIWIAHKWTHPAWFYNEIEVFQDWNDIREHLDIRHGHEYTKYTKEELEATRNDL